MKNVKMTEDEARLIATTLEALSETFTKKAGSKYGHCTVHNVHPQNLVTYVDMASRIREEFNYLPTKKETTMTIEMQMVLNHFIEVNASVETMSDIMHSLRDVKEWHHVVEVYRERGLMNVAQHAQKALENAKEECSKILKRSGIEYTIEDLIIL